MDDTGGLSAEGELVPNGRTGVGHPRGGVE